MPEVISLVPHALLVSLTSPLHISSSFFFFNDTATTEIYTLSLHDALPISGRLFRQEPERGAYHHREGGERGAGDRKSTRLNSSHSQISYAVFCLKKKKKNKHRPYVD